MPRAKAPQGSWEEVNRRVTFYCPIPVLEAIEREVALTGRSKSQVILGRMAAGGLVADDERLGEDPQG